MASLFGGLRRMLALRGRRRKAELKKADRRAAFEQLELRHLLSGESLVAIAGTVFNDQTGNGSSGDDVALVGVAVRLYRDGGNGSFDGLQGDDQFVRTAFTDEQGRYRFEGLVPATYFVEQTRLSGLQLGASGAVQSVEVTPQDMILVDGVTIDAFEDSQTIIVPSVGFGTSFDAPDTSSAIGGQRDMHLELKTSEGQVKLRTNPYGIPLLEIDSDSESSGRQVVTWDGPDSDPSIEYRGLFGVDLSDGGANDAISLLVLFDDLPVDLDLRIYSDAGNWSEAIAALPGGIMSGPVEYNIPFSQFVARGAFGGADFSDVGAIQLVVDTEFAGTDLQLGWIGSIGAKTLSADFANLPSLSLGDLVWYDANNNGHFDPATEVGIDGVALELYQDADRDGSYSPGVDAFVADTTTRDGGNYLFDGLLAGDYVVRVDPNNFAAGGALEGLVSSTGNDPAADPDNDVNSDDNGSDAGVLSTVTRAVTLAVADEPTNDGDSSATSNLSVDLGFTSFDLSIEKSDTPDPVSPGQQLAYQLVVTNHGPSLAQDVRVVDTLPPEVEFVSVTSSQGSANSSGQIVTAVLGDLPPGATANISIVVDVQPDTVAAFENRAEVTSSAGVAAETNVTNNHATELTEVVLINSSIAGFVYVDANDDGFRDSGETPIGNVIVALSGTNAMGQSVSRTTITNANGAYQFDNLLPGVYTVTETDPAQYDDGQDTPGVVPGNLFPLQVSVLDDVFANIAISGGVNGIEFNFGELTTDDEPCGKRHLLASSEGGCSAATPALAQQGGTGQLSTLRDARSSLR